jgi:N-hydroxyarylamine O-acetyltransferase
VDLSAYLDRISYRDDIAPTYETLRGVHRAHLIAIPYENLDIHLGRPLSLDQPTIFDKLVTRRRGGWCYEMNGLLAWALREMGFRVQLLSSAVAPATPEQRLLRDHLLLRVDLDRPYLADAGFGNGILDPLPLAEGEHAQGFLRYRLARDGDYWVFHNHAHGGPGFEFSEQGYALGDFAERCTWLQTSPASGFVRVAVCHRFRPDGGIVTLRGAVLTAVTTAGKATSVIDTRAAYVRTLREVFALDLPEAGALWDRVWPAHVAWVAAGDRY